MCEIEGRIKKNYQKDPSQPWAGGEVFFMEQSILIITAILSISSLILLLLIIDGPENWSFLLNYN